MDIARLALGDVVVLPDGRALTLRARASLPTTVGSMAGFVILGELELMLSVPSSIASPLLVYVPVSKLPPAAARARTAYEGVANYWAPHLPGLRGAMGELLFRVVEVRGSVDPIVIVYRGPEAVVFIRASMVYPNDLSVLTMRRDADSDVDVPRHAAVVVERGDIPDTVPDELREPVPARRRRRRR